MQNLWFIACFKIAPSHGLASFGIHFLSLKGCKLVDESMSASIVLCDVQLDDIRPDREKFITKFVELIIFEMHAVAQLKWK